MENYAYEIREEEVLLDEYGEIDVIFEVIIFEEWLMQHNALGRWAKRELENRKWKKNAEQNRERQWLRLSK